MRLNKDNPNNADQEDDNLRQSHHAAFDSSVICINRDTARADIGKLRAAGG
jgi:hypothetical protein